MARHSVLLNSAASIRQLSRGEARDLEFWRLLRIMREIPTVVYTVRFENVIYVLHAFQKKSPKGIKTAQRDVELARRRLRVAQQDYEERYGKAKH